MVMTTLAETLAVSSRPGRFRIPRPAIPLWPLPRLAELGAGIGMAVLSVIPNVRDYVDIRLVAQTPLAKLLTVVLCVTWSVAPVLDLVALVLTTLSDPLTRRRNMETLTFNNLVLNAGLHAPEKFLLQLLLRIVPPALHRPVVPFITLCVPLVDVVPLLTIRCNDT